MSKNNLTVRQVINMLEAVARINPLGDNAVVCLCEEDRPYGEVEIVDVGFESDGSDGGFALVSLHELSADSSKSSCKDTSEEIKVWYFDDAPTEYKALSTNGGDEDYVVFIPDSIKDTPYWVENFGGWECSREEHEVPGGRIWISSHA